MRMNTTILMGIALILIGAGVMYFGTCIFQKGTNEAERINQYSQIITSYVGIQCSDKIYITKEDISVTMPCGNKFSLKKGDKIPGYNIPCPCGDKRHWLFRIVPSHGTLTTPGGSHLVPLSIERTNLLPAQSWGSARQWIKANDAAWAAKEAKEKQ